MGQNSQRNGAVLRGYPESISIATSLGRYRMTGDNFVPAWFDDPVVVRQFPLLFRLYAGYCRVVANRRSGMITGGSFLLRFIMRLTRLIGGISEIPVEILDRVVYINLLDPRMLWVLDEMRAQAPEASLLRELLADGDTFLDIGANHGSFSLIASTLVGTHGRVVAFEPQPVLADLLRRSLTRTARCKWDVFQLACSDSSGTAEFFVPASNSGAASLFEAFSGTSSHTRLLVETERVDSVLDSIVLPGRVMIKMDVEGAELAALRGCESLVRRYAPAILVELNPSSSAAADSSVEELLKLLERFGYQHAFEIDSIHSALPISAVAVTPQRNLLLLHESRADAARGLAS